MTVITLFSLSTIATAQSSALNKANQLQKSREYLGAIKVYHQIIRNRSQEKHKAALYLGRAYYLIGETRKAHRIWNILLRSDAHPNIKKVAKHYRDRRYPLSFGQYKKEQSIKEITRFSGYFDISGSYHNNPFQDSQDEIDSSEESVADTSVNAEAFLSYKYISGDQYDSKLNLLLEGSLFQSDSEANSSLITVNLPSSYYLDSTRFRIIPSYQAERDDQDFILSTWSIYGDISYKWDVQRITFSLDFENYKSILEEYSYLEGYTLTPAVKYTYQTNSGQWHSAFSLQTKKIEDTSIETLSRKRWYLSGGYSHYWDEWILSLNVYLYKSFYEEDDTETITRNDLLLGVNSRFSYIWSSNISIYTLLDYSTNDSNFDGQSSNDDYNYQATEISVGLEYAF